MPEKEIKEGKTQFDFSGLTPNTNYYFRLFVKHEDGKSWDYESGNFTTPNN